MSAVFYFAAALCASLIGAAIFFVTHPAPRPVSFQQAAIACEANRAYVPSLQGQCLEDYVEAQR